MKNFIIGVSCLLINVYVHALQHMRTHQERMHAAIDTIKKQWHGECELTLLSNDGKFIAFMCRNRFYIYAYEEAKQTLDLYQRICFYDCDERICRHGWRDTIQSIQFAFNNMLIIGKMSHEFSGNSCSATQSDDYIFIYQISSKSYILISLPEDEAVYYKSVTDKAVVIGNKDTDWYIDHDEPKTYLNLADLKGHPAPEKDTYDLQITIFRYPFQDTVRKVLI